MGLWVVLGAVALASTTAVPVHTGVVAALLGALALGHGREHRRWLVAGPVAAAAVVLIGASVTGLLPDGIQPTYDNGPAGSIAPRVAWAAAAGVAGLDIAWGLFLHARTRQSIRRRDGGARAWTLARQQTQTQQRLRGHLDELDARVTAMETHLTSVP